MLDIRVSVLLWRKKNARPRQKGVFEGNSWILWELVSFCLRPAVILGSVCSELNTANHTNKKAKLLFRPPRSVHSHLCLQGQITNSSLLGSLNMGLY